MAVLGALRSPVAQAALVVVVALLASPLLWRPLSRRHVTPVIDIAGLTGPGRPEVVAALAQAAREHGIARLTGHGVDVTAARRAGRRYFELPVELKGCSECSRRNATTGFQRGYIPFAAESGLASVFEVKEGFSYGFEWLSNSTPEHPFQAPNVWPSSEALEILDSSWRYDMQTFFSKTTGVSIDIVSALAEALGRQGDGLDALCKGGETISQMRMFNYLPKPLDAARNYMGSSPHTDWHVVTIISRDAFSALQFRDRRTEEWVDVATDEDELVLLVGDWLSAYSDGQLHAPVHRVTLPEAQNSLSFVLFFYPSPSARLPQRTSAVLLEGADKDLNTVDESMLQQPWGDYVVQKWAKVMTNR